MIWVYVQFLVVVAGLVARLKAEGRTGTVRTWIRAEVDGAPAGEVPGPVITL